MEGYKIMERKAIAARCPSREPTPVVNHVLGTGLIGRIPAAKSRYESMGQDRQSSGNEPMLLPAGASRDRCVTIPRGAGADRLSRIPSPRVPPPHTRPIINRSAYSSNNRFRFSPAIAVPRCVMRGRLAEIGRASRRIRRAASIIAGLRSRGAGF